MKQYNVYKCNNCNITFERILKDDYHNRGGRNQKPYCSLECFHQKQSLTAIIVMCKNCQKIFNKKPKEVKKSPNHFCSRQCSGSYTVKNRKTGTRRSKLEVYIEKELTRVYPNLKILYNDKTTINSELDIYIPSLKLAFELNGIFHYEPIFGSEKLGQIQNNDERKFQACLEQEIELCIIDISSQKYFKESSSKKFLDIIVTLINKKY